MLKRFLNKQTKLNPFLVQRSGDKFFVGEGICFSTFNYGAGSFIPIKNIKTPFDFKDKEKFYINFYISQNLQVTGAEIKCQKVGSDCDDPSLCDWKNYPSMISIRPQDEFDEKGRVKTIKDGKRQLNCYTLIAIRNDDTIELVNSSSSSSSSSSKIVKSGIAAPFQILDSNIIMMASMYSGVPCVFPIPYFNGDLLNAVYGDINYTPIQITLPSSSSSSSSS